MARQFYHTNRFTRGEVEPALFDRPDVDFYAAACKRMKNWLPLPAGAAKRRPALTRGVAVNPGAGNTLLDVYVHAFSYAGSDYFLALMLVEDAMLDQSIRAVVYTSDTDVEEDLGELVEVEDADLAPLAEQLCFASAGPSVFITSRLFPPHRVFFNIGAGEFQHEAVTFYEELLGLATVSNASDTVTGEDTLFEEQLSTSDVIRIDGVDYTVSAIDSNTSLTLSTNYTGLSKEVRLTREVASPFGADEYPALCTFYQGRLLLFSTDARPVTMWASKAQDPFTILPGTVYDDAPIVFDLLADTGDRFLWVFATDRVFLGSRKMEATLFSDQGTTFTAQTFNFAKVASLGGAAAMPFATESNVVFLSSGRNQLFSARFDLSRQGFITNNLSVLSPQILDAGVVSFTYRPATRLDFTPRALVLKTDGTIAVCTLFEEEEVLGWSRLEPPPGFEFKAVAAASDEILTVVERDGTWFLSRLDFDVEAGYLLDFAETFSVTAGVVAVTDPLLDGLNVAVLDPTLGYLGAYDVVDGDIDLTEFDGLSEEVIVGIQIVDELSLLPAVTQERTGVILNQKRRVPRVMVSVNETRQVFVNGLPILPSLDISEELRPQTGVFQQWGLGWTSQDELRIEGATIYPARILSVTREVVT